jgi:glycosyltransferase involved in cell wall biosynthesis
MRVAWVTPYPPDRNGGGGHIREAHLLLALAGRASITLITGGHVTDPAVLAAAERIVEVGPTTANWLERGRLARRAGDLWGATVSRTAREARALRSLRAAMVPPLAATDADVVLIEYTGLTPLVDEPALAGLRARSRWVVTAVNLPSRMADHQAAIMPKRRQRWLFRREAGVARRFETRLLGRYDQVIAVSEEDRASLAVPAGVEVVANGVDLARFSPSPLPAGHRLVYTGALYTTPNTDAAGWFAHHILPLVRGVVPDAVLDVVGLAPPPAVRDLGRLPGVRVHGDVDDVRPFLRAARVAVLPVRIGSGTRLKAMEAWASGRPVVGTTLGLEGLGAADGEHALVADDPAAFAAAVVRVLTDTELAHDLAERGRALAATHHDWTEAARRFVAVIDGG